MAGGRGRSRLAVLGAGHWHAPLMMAGLEAADAEVEAVWDPDPAVATRFAARWGGRTLDAPHDVAGLVDAALVMGEPARMPDLAGPLLSRGTPVILEKPGAARLADLDRLVDRAERTGTPVAVPLVQRVAGVGRALADLAAGERVTAASFAFIAGGPDRYRAAGCDFMLDPARAGGGAMLNLGVHFVDLAIALCGETVEAAAGVASNTLRGERVEDAATIVMRLSTGAIATVEAGYGFPDSPRRRHFAATVTTDRAFIVLDGGSLRRIDRAGGERTLAVDTETDGYYAVFLARALSAFREGRPPPAGLEAMRTSFAVVDGALRSCRGNR